MNIRTFLIPAAALALAAAAAPAGAQGAGVNLDLMGAAVVTETLGGGAPLTGNCQYARYAAGVGGSGVTYEIVGAGAATGAYKGVPVVATGVRCRFFLGSAIYTSGPEYLPGAVAETDTSVTSTNAAGGKVCVTVYAVLRQTPPGETDNLINTLEQC